ncbi:DUF2490 domain-containing protein [Flavobacterium paronense]|uniref:DUF2490 domain-containing protein n=1 Tax=Flavobacterium paronense TaxID=1392775 RepID=A0ABV5GBR2_9FLAO|nr:DUF2490 domain-containing protein [Flavobacterium paronense]MDN3677641.1 DUF2490 domain-containing protein [Flavobacterium paronense]
MKRGILLLILVVLAGSKVKAQEHTNSWFRATLSIPIGTKFKTDFEGQLRRQNGFDNENPLDKKLLYSFRTWCYFKQSEKVTFAISPFAYFSNYKIIQKQSDESASPTSEYRFSAAIEVQHKMTSNLFLLNRTAFEYRVFEGATENVIRVRQRLGLRYDLNPKYNLDIGDEIFINAYGTDSQHLFDQNRTVANITFKPNDAIKFDLGYNHISRLPKSTSDLIRENNLYLNFTYTLIKKQIIPF